MATSETSGLTCPGFDTQSAASASAKTMMGRLGAVSFGPVARGAPRRVAARRAGGLIGRKAAAGREPGVYAACGSDLGSARQARRFSPQQPRHAHERAAPPEASTPAASLLRLQNSAKPSKRKPPPSPPPPPQLSAIEVEAEDQSGEAIDEAGLDPENEFNELDHFAVVIKVTNKAYGEPVEAADVVDLVFQNGGHQLAVSGGYGRVTCV